MRSRTWIGVLAVALAATGCSDPFDPSSTASSDDSFHAALARVDAQLTEGTPYFQFLRPGELIDLAKDDERWKNLVPTIGLGGPLDDQPFGLDLTTADYLLMAGNPPADLILVSGNQDQDRARDEAKKAGYTGDDVLAQDLDVTNKITVYVSQVGFVGSGDVVLGGANAEVGLIDGDGESVTDAEPFDALASCVGAAPFATLVYDGSRDLAFGALPDGDDVTSVLCVEGDDADAESLVTAFETGRTTSSSQEYSKFFTKAASSVDDGIVRITLTHAADTPALVLYQMAISRDLPS